MTTFNITLQDKFYGTSVNMTTSDIKTIFRNVKSFDDFQTVLIRIVNEQEMHAVVTNSRGNEIFTMRHNPNCSEGVCCCWPNRTRLNNFIKSFAA